MKRLALGVAALLVVTAGSVATATPNGRGGGWCERHSDAKPPPNVDRDRPATAGGGSRDGHVPNAFACYDASTSAGDQEVETSAVVNAWADHERGRLRLTCVQSGAAMCSETVELPAKADIAPPTPHVDAPSGGGPTRVRVDDQPDEPLVSVDVEGRKLSVDHGSVCVEVEADLSPSCPENPEGR